MNGLGSENKKPFGLVSATCLVIANMIGAGVFTTSGFSLAALGDRRNVLLAWVIGGCIALCGAISYGRLAQRITESGGEYLFLSRLLHPAIGFLAGWVSLLAGFTGAIAFAAFAFETYAFPASVRPPQYVPGTIAIMTIVGFGVLHAGVLRGGLWVQNGVVAVKLILLVTLIGFAFYQSPSTWPGMKIETAGQPLSIGALASTLVWISLSYSGFNAAIYVMGEVRDGKKIVPRALWGGTMIVALLYLVLNAIFLYGPLPESIVGKQDVAAIAAQAIGGNRLANLVRVIVSLALLSSVSSMIVAGPRVYAKMANDGLFPHLFCTSDSPRHEVPRAAIALQVLAASIVVSFSTLQSLLDYLSLTLSLSAALTVASLFWTGYQGERPLDRAMERGVAVLFVGATVGLATLAVIERPKQLIGLVATVASGLVLYGLLKRTRSGANRVESL